eukprot:7109085-Prymnesium_polylepis.2
MTRVPVLALPGSRRSQMMGILTRDAGGGGSARGRVARCGALAFKRSTKSFASHNIPDRAPGCDLVSRREPPRP